MTTFNEGDAHGVSELTFGQMRNALVSPKLSYTILTADTAIQLAHVVNVAIDDGWCPSGGVAVDCNGLMQAMVRNG